MKGRIVRKSLQNVRARLDRGDRRGAHQHWFTSLQRIPQGVWTSSRW